MTVDGVEARVHLTAGEPAVERLVGIIKDLSHLFLSPRQVIACAASPQNPADPECFFEKNVLSYFPMPFLPVTI